MLARLLPNEGFAHLQSAAIYALVIKSGPEAAEFLSAHDLKLFAGAIVLSPAEARI